MDVKGLEPKKEVSEYDLIKAAGVWHERLDEYIKQWGEAGKQVVWLFAIEYAGQSHKAAAEYIKKKSESESVTLKRLEN